MLVKSPIPPISKQIISDFAITRGHEEKEGTHKEFLFDNFLVI